ncbi:CHASE2 domain-containing protein [Roseibium aggregatum]|uniref:Adenylate/guanylate cyclase domain-containing protein n=1 Tax=Roseibium aggregatum TaxID=187304 RepID=A0A939EFY8_9HYPH|nr:adenylate/guanylate cyclase domain-containing protein [Roseibium aggregatum]MBN9672512.1 adenylate/guanylate cyclase domain-containing protein [Roseibium aggregatum]
MRQLFKTLLSKRGLVAIVACFVLTFSTGLRYVDPGFLTALRELTFDYYQRMKPRAHEPAPVRIVDIDETSIAEIGQWPWPRTKLAEMVRRLTDLGAAAIVFDVVFSEPDRTSPAQLGDLLAGTVPHDILKSFQGLPDHDTAFSAAIAEGPVVLGFAITDKPSQRAPLKKAGIAFAGENPTGFLTPFPGAVPNLNIFQEAASGIGSISVSRDDLEGSVRRVPLLESDGSGLFPSLSSEALRVAQGASNLIVRATGASGEASGGTSAVTAVKIGAFEVPTTASGELWVYYNEDTPARYVPARDLFEPDNSRDLAAVLEGHIVLVGASAAGLRDIRATSLGELVPGVSIHAQALEQIIHGQFLSRPDWADGLEIIATFAVGAFVILALPATGGIVTAILGAMIAAGLVGGSIYLFWTEGLLVDPIYPSVASFCVFAATTALLYVLTEREKHFVRQAFSQYLSPDLVTRLEDAPEQLSLGGEIRDMTILFMDVRDFTPISEELEPEDLVRFLNTLLSPLSDAIQAEGGTIDKYIGDSIMAFWNAPLTTPDHAKKACRAGLTMLKVMDGLNDRDAFGFKARGLKTQFVRIGIGLNSGEACVGNMGSARRFNYSVIGDAVNTASRIESSCKPVGVELLVSEDTRDKVPEFAFLEAGEIPLKGKSEPAKLFALIGDEAVKSSREFKELDIVHGRMLRALKGGHIRQSRENLEKARTIAPSLMDFYGRFEDMLDDMQTEEDVRSAAQDTTLHF